MGIESKLDLLLIDAKCRRRLSERVWSQKNEKYQDAYRVRTA
jgi:hypothetical protein